MPAKKSTAKKSASKATRRSPTKSASKVASKVPKKAVKAAQATAKSVETTRNSGRSRTTPARAMTTSPRVAAASNSGKARTVIYCHGIFDKPPEKQLRSEWDRALFGSDQGERTRMAYWVDRSRYPEKKSAGTKALGINGGPPVPDANAMLAASIIESDKPEVSAKFAKSLEAELKKAAAKSAVNNAPVGGPGAKAIGAKGFWTPITDGLTKVFLTDVNDFLFNTEKRNRMVKTVKDRAATGGGPFVVIGHSQGSMVAYQALMELGKSIEVDLFITLGSPLGLPQVTGELQKWYGKKLPIPPGVKRWINVARDGDIVCSDQSLSDEYSAAGKEPVVDIRIHDGAFPPTKAHDVGYYLCYAETRKAVAAAVDKSRFQQVGSFTVARNLSDALEDRADERVPVLIELADRPAKPNAVESADTLVTAKQAVEKWIEKHVAPKEADKEAIQLEVLDRYISAHLSRDEVERLAEDLGRRNGVITPPVYRMFMNSRKKALMHNSVATIQALTAQQGYNARGQGITWAVLDTGIDQGHPHFQQLAGGNIAAAWDCTKRGAVRPDTSPDVNGHGTHVAGVIAGGIRGVGGDPDYHLLAVAPKARLISYKVLADDGGGNDAWIIKAIDHIWAENERARRLVIHGVNLSLGGPFDATSFGCGDSPLCASLFRLIRQGVLVVLAAGNEGSGEIIVDGYSTAVSLDLSIGDPANLDEGISVGSVHPTLPHRYGTSYFSSRGPTADGRVKPDVVAPGERIWSCRSGGRGTTQEDLYIALSGTSMAAPHVSGLLASYLSVRTEFIGYPDRVKKVLLDHCTDLKRDRYHQGAGLPNLTKMLLNT
jgi:subtilisin family serine protease